MPSSALEGPLPPVALPTGPAAYLKHRGNTVYLVWCKMMGIKPLDYGRFRARTLSEGPGWWTLERKGG